MWNKRTLFTEEYAERKATNPKATPTSTSILGEDFQMTLRLWTQNCIKRFECILTSLKMSLNFCFGTAMRIIETYISVSRPCV